MILRKFQRIFTDNSHYGDFDKISYIDSLAFVTQEFLYSDIVEDEWQDFRMDERIKLYDFMTLVVYFVSSSVEDFGKATIKGYIEDIKTRKNSYQNEVVIEYIDNNYLLLTNASFELVNGLLWVAYIYSKVRCNFSKNEYWEKASEILYDIAWKESGYNKEAFKKLSLMKSTNQAIEMMQKHIVSNMSKYEKIQKESCVMTESEKKDEKNKDEKKLKLTNKIFIVHGHNEAVKEKVARVLEKLNLQPIILHEQPDGGKTIIEKFEANSDDVNFAVVLLTGDDKGKSNNSDDYKLRARQNVIFEMGYFMGRLSRSRVFMLLEEGVEKPSDLDGIVYTPLKEGWQQKLVKELKRSGYDVDANNIF